MPKRWLFAIPLFYVVIFTACAFSPTLPDTFPTPPDIDGLSAGIFPLTASITCFADEKPIATLTFFGSNEQGIAYLSIKDKDILIFGLHDVRDRKLVDRQFLKTSDGWVETTMSELTEKVGDDLAEKMKSCGEKLGMR